MATAPPRWTILQILTSNAATIIGLGDVWKESQEFWHTRSKNHAWSTGGYIVNAAAFDRMLFSEMSPDELQHRNVRFNATQAFFRACNKSGRQLAQRLRCKGKIKFMADKYIYELGAPHVFISTIPLLIFLSEVESGVSSNHMKTQKDASVLITSFVKQLWNASSPHSLPIFLRNASLIEPSFFIIIFSCAKTYKRLY